MKKFKRITATALSVLLATSGMTGFAEDANDYSDYIPNDIPENLIPSYKILQVAANGASGGFAESNTLMNLTLAEGKSVDANNWRIVGGSYFCSGLNKARADGSDERVPLEHDYFEPGKTYVLKTKVKKRNEADSGTPTFGFAIHGEQGYAPQKVIYSSEYGKAGKAVTSTEFEDFADTITFPETWNIESKSYEVGQNIFIGMTSASTAPTGLSFTVTPGIDTFYLAEEVAYDITVSGEENGLNCYETIDLTAEVVNQAGIKGTMKQNFKWYAVNEERTAIEEGITVTENSEGSATVSVSADTEYGTYYVIAESEDYEGFRKGFEIEVKKPPLKDYQPGESEESKNYIQKPSNSGFATASSDNVKVTAGDGYVTVEALEDIESELGAEGLRVRNVGANGLPSSFNFEPGKTYAIKAKVRNPEPENDVYFNVSISNSTADTLSLTNEYGTEGLLLTGEWQEFSGSIRVSENYDYDAAVKNRNLTLGLNSGSAKGAKADIELSVFVGDIVAYDLVLDGEENAVLGADDSFEAKASVVNSVGGTDGLSQEFDWYLLDSEKVNKTDALKIEVSDDTNTATVLTDIYSESGVYYLVAESKEYEEFVKSIRFEVDKPSAEECIKEILKTSEKDALSGKLEEYLTALNIETDIENINYENLAEIIVGSRSIMTDENMNDFLKKAIVISAYENSDGLYETDGSFKYDEELNLKALDKDGVTVYSIFENDIKTEGKKALQKALEGEYKSFEEFEKAFAEQVILKAIEYPAKSGLGTLELILTKENAEAADIEIDEYLDLENKVDAAEHILNKSFTKETLEDAIDNIEKTIEDAEDDNKPSGNKGSSSSGGGSSSGGSSVAIAPSVTINNSNNEENTEIDSELGKEGTFTDVREEHWAYRDIYYLNKINIVSGIGGNLFNPDGKVTREQFVKMICEAFKYEIINEASEFSDVSNGAWYEKYIVTAVKKGIINGTGDGKFGVGHSITREDMAVIINRALGENSAGELESDFQDFDEISEYAKDSVTYLNSIGVINGFNDGSFMPKAECTRAQAAKIICTILNLKGDE